ncbi:MAG: carboxylate-amine ligase [Hyphomicrobium sp.]|jgi:carboxylate-amine ligase
MGISEPSFTFGIEEEYHLVDLESRGFASAPTELMKACEDALGGQVAPEFFRSQIEVGTSVLRDFKAGRRELAGLRRTIADISSKYAMAPIAASTHPFADRSTLETTPKARYQALAKDFGGIGRRLAICGMHVHVAIEDEDLRIDLMNQVRYFLPHLLMLSTSSPFWQGEDTGLKSYRLAVFHELPRTGLPQRFESFSEYKRTVDVLVRNEVIEDSTKIWWDLRPSGRFPTLEMRVTDICTRIDDAISIAALYACTLRMLWRLRITNQKWRSYPSFLIEENRWRAQRYGVRDTLFDFGKGTLVPFATLIDELIDLIAEDAAVLGCEREVKHALNIATGGTSADRQVACYEKLIADGASIETALIGVVDQLIAETVAGT